MTCSQPEFGRANAADVRSVDRRSFLRASVACTGLATAAGISDSSHAADPVERNGKPHLKLSLAGYSFNRLLARNWTPESREKARMTLEQFIDFCAEQDLDGTELTGYYFPRELTTEYLLQLKQQTFRLGLDISGTAIGNDFCLPEGAPRDAQLKMCRDWIDHAAILGAPVIRIFAGKVPKGETEQAAFERCVAGINRSLEYAAERGVVLALENHGGITATPDQLLKIVNAVDSSPWFGVNFDSGNFRTDDPYRDLARIAPYAVNAQIKVAVTIGGKKQPADLARIVDILQTANYRGYVVLEYEESRDPFEHIPAFITELRKLTQPLSGRRSL